ncbi:MAG: 4'-phosphopantetheinyl transferase superfamily protein [Prevotella sp.]|nr:4'-phosphopantetheinyl transferase superfamily protein [Prevotella sp.]
MIYLNDDIAHFDFEAALPLLSEQRREQALRFKHEQGRKTCAAAYLLLCEGLRKEYGLTERPVFEYGEYGKPAIMGHPEIHFNLSHCREAVICAISDRPVGVDIESIREYKESLARYTMNDDELTRIAHSTHPAQTFTCLWTMKEAMLKLTGEGIQGRSLRHLLTGAEQIKTTVCEEKNYVYSVVFE